MLTARLAARCDALLALDVNQGTLNNARRRCRTLRHVRFVRMQVPSQFPYGQFDLVVLSEVGYYWSAEDLQTAAQKIIAAMNDEGSVVLVHWTAPVAAYPLDGDAVHKHFVELARRGNLRHERAQRHAAYRLDVCARTGAG